jgi:glutamate/tyrosine decarboxylase-like PLP-dependent enzyme
MAHNDSHFNEETLDPRDWQSMQALGERMIADMVAYTRTLRDRPVWQPAPDEVKAHFSHPLPLEPQAVEDVYTEFKQFILPYPVGNIHPRFWGWVMGTGTLFGAYADFLASAMNTNSGGIDHHSANYVERQVIGWFKEMLGYPPSASGVLTSGCSAANLIGLAVGLNSMAGFDVRREGLSASPQKMVLYASSEIHSSIEKSVILLGLGSHALRIIPVNDSFQINNKALRGAIDADRIAGLKPFCVVGGAGTANTGSIDDLNALADICEEEELWFHVDGAFGAWAVLAPTAKAKVRGMHRADSLAVDLHKLMYMPFELGCIFVKNEAAHRQTFALTPTYLAHGEGEGGMTGGDLTWFSDYGFQLTRGFRALKAWMSLKQHGVNKYGRIIEKNVQQADYLSNKIQQHPDLELIIPPMFNIVCFRFSPAGIDDSVLSEINKQIVTELQEKGIAAPSGTILNGKYVIHVSITNHRSSRADFDLLLGEVLKLGSAFLQQARIKQ